MKREIRTVVYDEDLHIEAYRFEGFVRPFPSHFHEYYVIGYIESGQRTLSCNGQQYAVRPGHILVFDPGDSHACVQSDGGTLDYRGFNISREVIIAFPVPVLKASCDTIKAVRERLYRPEFQELTVVDFSDLAQGCRTYDEFIQKMGQTSEETLKYLGVAICGPKKKVNQLTGSMPLLR